MLNLLEAKGMQANVMLQLLEETFPPTNPTPSDPYEYVMYRAGQRSVVEWITDYLENNG
jgi:hypothetical protein